MFKSGISKFQEITFKVIRLTGKGWFEDELYVQLQEYHFANPLPMSHVNELGMFLYIFFAIIVSKCDR